jgi:hypothetical protein
VCPFFPSRSLWQCFRSRKGTGLGWKGNDTSYLGEGRPSSPLVTPVLGYSRSDSLGGEVQTSLLQRWAHLDAPTRTFHGPHNVHEALDAFRLLAKENGLRSRHVLGAVHHAIVAPSPRRQYTVGLDTEVRGR